MLPRCLNNCPRLRLCWPRPPGRCDLNACETRACEPPCLASKHELACPLRTCIAHERLLRQLWRDRVRAQACTLQQPYHPQYKMSQTQTLAHRPFTKHLKPQTGLLAAPSAIWHSLSQRRGKETGGFKATNSHCNRYCDIRQWSTKGYCSSPARCVAT